MVEFVVSNVTMGFGRLNVTRSEIRIVIKLARQYTYHLSQSFFQSFLLGFLAYLTFWIDITDFTDRFMGSLTALLVLASLMSTLTESLPKTSYFKVIDFWLLFFLLSTSLNIAVHILVDRFYQKELKEKKSKNVVQVSLFPRLFLKLNFWTKNIILIFFPEMEFKSQLTFVLGRSTRKSL